LNENDMERERHALIQDVTATFAHPLGCAAL